MSVKSLIARVRYVLGAGAAAAGEVPKDDGKPKVVSTPTELPIMPGDTGLAEAVARIRETMQWLVGSIAAVAALVLATTPYGNIGKLQDERLAVAIIGLVLAAAGVAGVVTAASRIKMPIGLGPRELVLAEIDAPAGQWPDSTAADDQRLEVRRALDWLEKAGAREVMSPAGTPAMTWLVEQRDAARDDYLRAYRAVDATADPVAREAAEKRIGGLKGRFFRLDGEVGRLVDLANVHRLTARYHVARGQILALALVGAAGLGMFVYAINPPEAPKAATPASLAGVDLTSAHGADLVGANLSGATIGDVSGADLSKAKLIGADLTSADLTGATLTGADLTAANMTGARGLDPVKAGQVTWISATCPNGERIRARGEDCLTDGRAAPK